MSFIGMDNTLLFFALSKPVDKMTPITPVKSILGAVSVLSVISENSFVCLSLLLVYW